MSCCQDTIRAPLGGAFASVVTAAKQEEIIQAQAITAANVCCAQPTPPGPLTVQTPSQLLAAQIAACPIPTPAQFAQFPKVAVPESVRVANLANGGTCATLPDPEQRFAQYIRRAPPVPCQALPQEANMAGKSLPSTRNCPPWPR
jgi:hypothetical protein